MQLSSSHLVNFKTFLRILSMLRLRTSQFPPPSIFLLHLPPLSLLPLHLPPQSLLLPTLLPGNVTIEKTVLVMQVNSGRNVGFRAVLLDEYLVALVFYIVARFRWTYFVYCAFF